MTAEVARHRRDAALLSPEAVFTLADKGYWFCGGCQSVIPAMHWHRCEPDGSTHSGPADREGPRP